MGSSPTAIQPDMHPSQQLKKYVSLNELAYRYFKQPGMTPAAAALIVSGVLPMPGCTDIPDQGVLLEDQVTPATNWEFGRARWLLKYWVESERSDEGLEDPIDDAHLKRILAKETTFHNFLIWCYGIDAGTESFRPRLFDYFLAFIRPKEAQTLIPAPPDIIDHAYVPTEHEGLPRATNGASAPGQPGVRPEQAVAGQVIRRNGTGKRQTAIAPTIREVQKALSLDQRYEPLIVWAELKALIEPPRKHAVLKAVNDKGIVYRGTNRDRIYTYEALRKHLGKEREAALSAGDSRLGVAESRNALEN